MTEEEPQGAAPYVWRPAAREEQPAGPAPYPRPVRIRKPADAPADLSGRKARKWKRQQVRGARREHREELAAAVQSWRVREDQVGALGVAVLLVAVVIAALVWLWPSSDADPSPAAASSSSAPAVGLPAAPTGPVTVEPGDDDADGHDHEESPPPAELAGELGEVAHRFLLAYNTYNPAFPDPGPTWVATWEDYATGELVADAPAAADRLWLFTVTDVVSPIAVEVRACTQPAPATWECDVARNLWPIGGSESDPYSTDVARWRVTVIDGDGGPWVSSAELLATTAGAPA